MQAAASVQGEQTGLTFAPKPRWSRIAACRFSPKPAITIEEYLDLERSTELKHEYYRGEVFTMGGASYAHTGVVGNLAREIGQQLKGDPCRAFPTDLCVRVGDSGLYTAENRLEASIDIASIGCELNLAEVYVKVDGLREPLAHYG